MTEAEFDTQFDMQDETPQSAVIAEYAVTDSAGVYKKFTVSEGLRTFLRFILPCSALFILLGVVALLPTETGDKTTEAGIIFLVLAVGFPILFGGALWFGMSRQLKTNKAYFAGTMTVTFFEDSFWVRLLGEGIDSVEKFGYDKIFKVKKMKGLTIIYMSSNSVFIVDKQFLSAGSEAVLTEKLRALLGKKYKSYGK